MLFLWVLLTCCAIAQAVRVLSPVNIATLIPILCKTEIAEMASGFAESAIHIIPTIRSKLKIKSMQNIVHKSMKWPQYLLERKISRN